MGTGMWEWGRGPPLGFASLVGREVDISGRGAFGPIFGSGSGSSGAGGL